MSKKPKLTKEEKLAKKQNKKAERKKKKDGLVAEFKKFVMRGNVVDMAIGMIVGSAFTAIVTALSNQILKPLINCLLALMMGKDSLDKVFTFLQTAWVKDEAGNKTTEIDLANSIYIDWGAFINAILNFLIVALCLFTIMKIFASVSRRMHEGVHGEKIAAEKAAAEAKAAEEKAAAEAKAAAEKAAAEAKAETERQFYENVAKQTQLLEEIAAKMQK